MLVGKIVAHLLYCLTLPKRRSIVVNASIAVFVRQHLLRCQGTIFPTTTNERHIKSFRKGVWGITLFQSVAHCVHHNSYLREIPHKVIEYLYPACFVYFVFLIDIDLINEISEQIIGQLGNIGVFVHDFQETLGVFFIVPDLFK